MDQRKLSAEYLVVEPRAEQLTGRVIDPSRPPRVSFCIPTLNNEGTLERCLQSIVSQDYPDLEIVIVDGGSTDRTLEIAQKFTGQIYFDRGTLGSARQTSVEHATGPVVALFDSDIVIPHRQWLARALRYFNCPGKVSTVWPVNLAPPGSPFTTRLYFNHWKIVIEDRISKGRGLYGGGNSLFWKAALEEIGGISRELHWGEDFDWSQKLKDRGWQVVYLRDPLYHDTMRSLKQYTRKQFMGASSFTRTGFGLMNLSLADTLYEQFLLGLLGMLRGLALERDASWLLYPAFLSVKVLAYCYGYTLVFARRARGVTP